LHGENLTLEDISEIVQKALNIDYKHLRLPRLFWFLAKKSKQLIFRLEKLIPNSIYNPIWRASLIVDHTIYCDAIKAKNHIPDMTPKKFCPII